MNRLSAAEQLADLGRGRGRDRGEIAGLARADQALDGQERGQGAAHAEPDQAGGHEHHHQHRQEGVGEDVGGERLPFVAGVRHHHGDPGAAGVGDEAAKGHRPDRGAEIDRVHEPRAARGGGRQRRREIGIAGDQPAVGRRHAVEDPVATAGREQRQGGMGQIDRDGVAVDLDLLGDAERRGEQKLVEGAVRGAGRVAGEQEVDAGGQEGQDAEQAAQQAALQRPVLNPLPPARRRSPIPEACGS